MSRRIPGRYKLIAIDMDGTLLSNRGEVTPRTKAAIHRCLSAGILICFATGRNWTESQVVLDAVEHYDSAVFVGGAMVVDTKQRVMLHRVLMDKALASELSEMLESNGHAVMAAQVPASGHEYVVSGNVELLPAMKHWLDHTQATVRKLPTLSTFDHSHTIRLSVIAAMDSLDDVQRAIDVRFADRIFYHRMTIPHKGVELMEIFDPSVNKWEGILHVARKHDVLPEEIVAIGDDFNDLHMIRNAGLGVAMGNARPEVQRLAKRVIGTNEQEGLAKFLEELVDQHEVEATEVTVT
ncbi:MAG: Cof-type HAD-IIB family hydrolase [Anaerolineae bacterium]|nr:Cof-type HAD-IIB family hydrolase [Phycisphaerae bacterium]